MTPLFSIVEGDCVKTMRLLESGSVDLTVTSPPYDDLRAYEGFSFSYEDTIRELYRVTRPGGVVVWVVSDETSGGTESCTSFRQALFAREVGFHLYDTMIWDKGSSQYPGKGRYRSVFDYMFVLSKGKPKTVHLLRDRENLSAGKTTGGGTRLRDGSVIAGKKALVCREGIRTNVWHIPPESSLRGCPHPAVFPVQIPLDHILTWSAPGDLILDPMAGSGTTGVAAIRAGGGRKFLGIDCSRAYCEYARRRIYGEFQKHQEE